jgi:peptidoglycan/LPS O-acetylase OafA/YrhL
VVHQPILFLLPDRLRIVNLPPGSVTNLHWLLLWAVVYGSLCFAVAWISFHLLERPFLRLKDRFPYGDAGTQRLS